MHGIGQSIDPLGGVMVGILNHPAFDSASRRYIDNVIDWRRRLGRFNKVGHNLGFHIVNYVMYLHFVGRAGTNQHGATFSALLEICEGRQQCGSRALRTVLTLLTVLGHLRVERSSNDGRIRTYAPSERLIGEATEIYGYCMQVLDELLPGSDYAGAVRSDPAFLPQIVSKSGRAVVEDRVLITEHFPGLHNLISQAGGLPTTISLANAQLCGTPFPSAAEIAKRFAISPSQVRTIINAAATAGLIERAEDGAITGAERLIEEHRGLIARELALHAKYALGCEDHFLRHVK